MLNKNRELSSLGRRNGMKSKKKKQGVRGLQQKADNNYSGVMGHDGSFCCSVYFVYI
jgi:hypothetical protein